jgi:hypothetical protein
MRPAGELVELPSRNMAWLRRPVDLAAIAASRDAPPHLLREVDEFLASSSPLVGDAAAQRPLRVACAFVEPVMTMNRRPGRGEISMYQLDSWDFAFVVSWLDEVPAEAAA